MKRIFAFIMIFLILFNSVAYANEKTASFLNSVNNEDIKTGSIGGEWLVIAKARGGNDTDFETYYNNLCSELTAKNGDIDRKYTTYSRIIIALTAIGKNPENAAGYNLLEKLEDFDKVTSQGINGAIFAVIATKCGSYKNSQCENYLSYILSKQNTDGSFSLSGEGDIDVTAMALQALSFYSYRENVKPAINKALVWLEDKTPESSESYSQLLVAYTALKDFVSRDKINSAYIGLMEFGVDGGFCHLMGEGFNQMASEQASYAIAAYERYNEGKTSLYDINNRKVTILNYVW